MGEPAAQQPGGQGGPAAPLPGDRPPGTYVQLFEQKLLHKTPAALLPGGQVPAARQLGGQVYSCKFPNQKYIFVKNENEK